MFAREAAAAAATTGDAGGSAGGAGRGRSGAAGANPAEARANLKAIREEELTGIAAISEALNRAYEDAKNIDQGIGESLVGAFQSAEEAVADFVQTGKLDISELASSVIADFARMAARSFLFAPLSSALSGALGGFGGLGGAVSAVVQHDGGMAGTGPRRSVTAAAFLQAPRLHAGAPMGLRADEYAAILQRGERVLNRRQTHEYEHGAFGGPTVVTIQTRDAASFWQSRTQIAADLARAVARGRRGM